MEAGVKLVYLFLTILLSSSSTYCDLDISEEFMLYVPQEDDSASSHSIEKRQVSTRVDWSETEPYLDGPYTDEIIIDGNTIYMNEEIEPDVIIAVLNYAGLGDVSFRFTVPSTIDDQLGLKAQRQSDGSIHLVTTMKQDYEAGHLIYRILVTVTEAGTIKTQNLEIQIINIDDNPPVVLAPPCAVDELYVGITDCVFNVYDADGYISLNVMELRFIGSEIVNRSFNLIDRVNNSNFNFSITLNVIEELDFFFHQIHIFELIAFDSLPNNGSAQVIVRVNDVPNMPPMWQSVFATMTFDEKTSQTFTVSAIDGDTGINKPICYDLEKDFDDPVITIGETDGVIDVEPIDRDRLEREIFSFDIVAYKCDNRSWTAPSSAVFVVNDINDQKPEIVTSNFEISILEETYESINFPEVITIHDRDLALNARYTVALESIDPPTAADAFLIIPRDGYQRQEFQIAITDASMLDFDSPGWETVTLRIVATEVLDPINHVQTAVVTIHLQNWNDERPIFSEDTYIANLEETVEADYYVATVKATDRDVGDLVIHSIRGTTQEYLSIDEETGVIRVKVNDAFDYDRQQEVIVQVVAQDTLNSSTHAVNTVITQLTINVIDVNNKPPQITMPREPTRVVEHVLEGTVITDEILGSDVDTDADLLFEIDWVASYATKQGRLVELSLYEGCVEIETVFTDESSRRNARGRLIAKQIGDRDIDTLDFEVIEVLYLSIILTDLKTVVGANSTQGILAINIEDINDNPPVWNPDTNTKQYFVREEADTDVVIDSVQATDIDGPQYNVISYFIEPINGTGDDLVKINPNSGQITVELDNAISADLPPTYYLYYTLTASDCTEETGTDCYHVNIDIAIDIIDTNNQTPFREEDEDDQKPVRIEEHSPDGSYVTTINGMDWDRDDPYNKVSYTIDYRTIPELEKVFLIDIDTGVITTRDPVDLERDYGTTRYTVPIQMIDNFYFERERTQRTNSTSIEVILIDINDNAPEFQTINVPWTVSENADQNSYIATVRAYDRDEEDTPRSRIEYEIISVTTVRSDGSEVEVDLFDVNTVTENDGTIYRYVGNIVTKTPLESHWGVYSLVIEARDMVENPNEVQRNWTTQQLTVEPHNFNVPVIIFPENGQTIRLSLEEAAFGRLRYASNGSMLNLAKALDEDGGDAGRVSFQIVGDETSVQFFSLETYPNNEAQFQLDDRITEPSQYTLTMVATDHGTPPLSSNITFVFEIMSTESMPQFLMTQYITNFTESDIGQSEEKILPEARDPLGDRELFYYFADNTEVFMVNKSTRVMRLLDGVQLDRSDEDRYEIKYRVSIVDPDSEGSPRHAEMQIVIEVREANPKPVFELQRYVGGISIIDDVSKRITTIQAHHSENLTIEYAIEHPITVSDSSLENVKDRAFAMDNNTGDLTLEIKPLATMTGYFEFAVSAIDTNAVLSRVQVVVFVVSEGNRITFTFLNTLEEVESKRATVVTIFSEEFQYECSIDSIVRSTDADGLPDSNKTDVRTHFMDDDGVAISADILAEKRGDYEFVSNIIRRFNDHNLNLGDFLPGSSITESLDKMLQIILIVVSSVLGALCVILVIAFCLRTRSLNRRLDALSTTKFGSQDSGLNRVGITVPGTNKHALEGSNPVWNEDIKAPSFDQLSNYSGDSDLIGIEDNPQFAYDNRGSDKHGNTSSTIF